MSNLLVNLPLQRKVAVTLFLVFTVFSGLSYAVLTGVIAPAFHDLDLAAARTNLVRAQRAIQTDIDSLATVNADWAPWDDMYGYARGVNPGFLQSNLDRSTLTNLGLELLAIFSADGKLLWGEAIVGGKTSPVGVLGILGPDDRSFRSLVRHSGPDARTVGIVQTRKGPMLISSMPILHTDESGPIAGSVVMGKFLDKAHVARLRKRTEVDFECYPVTEFSAVSGIDANSIGAGDAQIITSQRSISSFVMLTDIFAEPLLILEAETPRRIAALGDRTVRAALSFLVVTGVFVTIIIWYLLRGTILKPIESLAEHIRKIRNSGDLSHKLELRADDEIGGLAADFDGLTSALEEARKALLFQSFKAGKADTAAEVLHNIRNAMTPMINGLERLAKAFKIAGGLRVTEATHQLADPNCPPDRAAKYLQYIDASFDRIRTVNAQAAEDLQVVAAQAKQVEGILTDQEKFTNAAPVEEDVVVREVVGEAAHVIPKDTPTRVALYIDDAVDRYRVRAHRIALLQVLGNLLLNAYESIARCNRGSGRISLTATELEYDKRPMVRLTVRDDGTGFNGETSERLFRRGFTSKAPGNTTGLGLHWCANAVRGMGGWISAESEGTGKGAEFHVLLPAAQGGFA